MIELSASAAKIVAALRQGPATFDELRVRVRPMSDAGIVRAMGELDGRGLVALAEHYDTDGVASLTDAGREVAG